MRILFPHAFVTIRMLLTRWGLGVTLMERKPEHTVLLLTPPATNSSHRCRLSKK